MKLTDFLGITGYLSEFLVHVVYFCNQRMQLVLSVRYIISVRKLALLQLSHKDHSWMDPQLSASRLGLVHAVPGKHDCTGNIWNAKHKWEEHIDEATLHAGAIGVVVLGGGTTVSHVLPT